MANASQQTGVNAPALLNFTDRGTIAAGQRADLLPLNHKDGRALTCELGGDPVDTASAWASGAVEDAGCPGDAAALCVGRKRAHDFLRKVTDKSIGKEYFSCARLVVHI